MGTPAAHYRPDIDGLRALAVTIVILFHLKVHAFRGGYVGVDVFFVISGYLITKIIFPQIADGTFSFRAFFLRRARRLLPALYVVILSTAIAGWYLLPPQTLLDFGRSAVAVFLFASNVLFWSQTGYFDAPALEKPLLHTWSLSVEEQFYLMVPLCLFVVVRIFKSRRSLKITLGAALVASFVLCCVHTWSSKETAFYLPFDRAWEFLIGSCLIFADRTVASKAARVALVVFGVVCIALATKLYGQTTPFPGPAALLPCLGAALIIFAGGSATASSPSPALRFAAYVGRLSYSLYLWHWPVYVLLLAYRDQDASGPYDLVIVVAITIALSVLSYTFVEVPFRAKRALKRTRSFLSTLGLSAACFASLVYAAGAYPALRGRYGAESARFQYDIKTYPWKELYRGRKCFLDPDQSFADVDRTTCFSVDATRTNVLLWGDSLSADYLPGLQQFARSRDLSILQFNASACPPLLGHEVTGRPFCKDFNDDVVKAVVAAKGDIVVLMGADWTGWYQSIGSDAFLAMLEKTVTALSSPHVKIVLLGPPVRWKENLPNFLVRHATQEISRIDTTNLLLPGAFDVDRDFRAFASKHGIAYLSVLGTVCPKESCPSVVGNDVPITWDLAHLTKEGSEYVVGKLTPQLQAIVQR